MTKAAKLTAVLNFIVICVYSQKNLQSGYIVLNNKDTLNGFINYREWSKNPSGIEFTPSKGEEVKWYTKDNISYFQIADKESYRKHLVSISLDRSRINDISEKDTAHKTDEVFLKLLHEGKNVSLLSYGDEIKMRYYILTSDQSNPIELKNSIYMLDGKMVSEKEYRIQFRAIVAKYAPADADLIKLVNNSAYSKKYLLNICYRLNGVSADDKLKKSNKSPVRFFAGGGIDKRSSSFSGDIKYSGSNSSSVSPMLIAGIDILFNPEVEKFYLHNSINYSSSHKIKATFQEKYYEATNDYRYELKQSLIAFNSQLIWNMYNQPSFKIFVGGGAGAHFSSDKTNKQTYYRYGMSGDRSVAYTEDYLYLSRFWLNVNLTAGVTVKGINVAINYIPETVISDAKNYSLKTSNLQLQLTYVFTKRSP